jgi:hypothetical protein
MSNEKVLRKGSGKIYISLKELKKSGNIFKSIDGTISNSLKRLEKKNTDNSELIAKLIRKRFTPAY